MINATGSWSYKLNIIINVCVMISINFIHYSMISPLFHRDELEILYFFKVFQVHRAHLPG